MKTRELELGRAAWTYTDIGDLVILSWSLGQFTGVGIGALHVERDGQLEFERWRSLGELGEAEPDSNLGITGALVLVERGFPEGV